MADKPRNMAASVRARLLDIARRRQLDNNLLLTRYAHERLLYRLSTSDHRDRFALKGAMLVSTWFENPYRPTRDVDLLGFGDPDAEAIPTESRPRQVALRRSLSRPTGAGDGKIRGETAIRQGR